MKSHLRVGMFALAILGASAAVRAAQTAVPPPRFELIGGAEGWLALRENVRDAHEPLADCGYAGLAPGVRAMSIHFLELSQRHARGDLMAADKFAASFAVNEPASSAAACTPRDVSEKRRKEAEAFASSHGIELANLIKPLGTFGAPVRAEVCEANKKLVGKTGCDASFKAEIDGNPIAIARVLTAVPRAPDYVSCQFVGHRFVAALQVKWLELGTAESLSAPGGFAEHYDCRSQLFMPLRLYALPNQIVVLASFRGDNSADTGEYLHVLVLPRTP